MWHCLMNTTGGACAPAPCSALCAGELHTHLIWWHDGVAQTPLPLMAQILALANPMLDVVSVEPAPEATHPPSIEAAYAHPYLVTCLHQGGVQTGDTYLGLPVLLDQGRGL